jgi:hypothetical protein
MLSANSPYWPATSSADRARPSRNQLAMTLISRIAKEAIVTEATSKAPARRPSRIRPRIACSGKIKCHELRSQL